MKCTWASNERAAVSFRNYQAAVLLAASRICLYLFALLSHTSRSRHWRYKMTLQAIKWENGKLEILDQILLPAISRYIPVRGVEDGWKVINKMQVCFPKKVQLLMLFFYSPLFPNDFLEWFNQDLSKMMFCNLWKLVLQPSCRSLAQSDSLE